MRAFRESSGAIPPEPLAASWHRRQEIFQPFQKGVFLPQLDFIYDSGAGVGRAGLGSLFPEWGAKPEGDAGEQIPLFRQELRQGRAKFTLGPCGDPPEQLPDPKNSPSTAGPARSGIFGAGSASHVDEPRGIGANPADAVPGRARSSPGNPRPPLHLH